MKEFTFIDLFAGIGGFHLSLHALGGKCVYASEWNEHARKTYRHNFYDISPGLFDSNQFKGDITLEENQKCIPLDVDILCAGFPCQPFSQAGFKKGFDEARGTLFFEVAKIIQEKQPKAIFLENVRNLLKHNDGETFQIIKNMIEKELSYSFYWSIVKASDFGLPTHRPRLFMIGFRNDIKDNLSFEFPKPFPLKMTMSDVFDGVCEKKIGYTLRVGGRGSGLHDRRNWDAYIVNGKEKRITSQEAKKMMGFPETFNFPVSETQALKQFGNSVAINPIQMTARNVIRSLKKACITHDYFSR